MSELAEIGFLAELDGVAVEITGSAVGKLQGDGEFLSQNVLSREIPIFAEQVHFQFKRTAELFSPLHPEKQQNVFNQKGSLRKPTGNPG